MYTQKSSFLAILDYATFERKLGIATILLFAYSMHLKKTIYWLGTLVQVSKVGENIALSNTCKIAGV